jgi:ribosomal protein S18 acetylase RimI-like enzyme
MAAHPRSFMLSAWMGAHLVGNVDLHAAGASFSAHVGEVGLGVLQGYQGLGLGRILTERLIALAEEQGILNLTLRVRTFNTRAIRLYESVGFVRVGTLLDIARLPEGSADEHVYQRRAGVG